MSTYTNYVQLHKVDANTVMSTNLNSTTVTGTGSSAQIVIQPAGTGTTYSIGASANPAASVALSLYDPGMVASNIQLGAKKVVAVSVTGTTLTSAQSGSTISISNAAGAYSINLPTTLLAGMNYQFEVASALNAAVTIAAGSAIIFGSLLSSDGTAVTGGNIVTASPKSNIVLGTTSNVGDTYVLSSPDGAKWHIVGVTAVHGAVTVS